MCFIFSISAGLKSDFLPRGDCGGSDEKVDVDIELLCDDDDRLSMLLDVFRAWLRGASIASRNKIVGCLV